MSQCPEDFGLGLAGMINLFRPRARGTEDESRAGEPLVEPQQKKQRSHSQNAASVRL